MSTSPYLSCHELCFHLGAVKLFQNVCWSVHPGERWGVVGANGAGKSTLFRMISGQTQPDSGSVSIRKGIRVAFVEQSFQVDQNLTVREILKQFLLAAEASSSGGESDLHANGVSHDNLLHGALRQANLFSLQNDQLKHLSGGLQKRVQIVSALLQNPQLILLDEPTNHLDIETVDWLEEFLLKVGEQGGKLFAHQASDSVSEEPVALAIISHDRALLDTLACRILEIENGEATEYEGNYEAYSQKKLERALTEKKNQAKMQNLMRRELAWLRAGTKARTTKQTSRIERALALDARLKNQQKKAFATQSVEMQFSGQMVDEERDQTTDAMVPVTRQLSEQELLRCVGVTLEHPDQKKNGHLIGRDLDFVVKPRMRIALVGPNGCGKSTLLQAIAFGKTPQKGAFEFHELTKISYFDQSRNFLDKNKTVVKTVLPEGDFVFFNGQSLHVFSYLERFLFYRFDAHRKVSELSGGEQARILLAKLMLEQGNLLILDEPTNDLDIQTLQTLEKNLLNFQGGILFTSHDRYFLQKVATHLLTYLGEREVDGERHGQWMMLPDLDQAFAQIELFQRECEQKNNSRRLGKTEKNAHFSDQKLLKKKNQSVEKEIALLEKNIGELETTVSRLESRLEELSCSGKEHAEIRATLLELEKAKDRLEQIYQDWHAAMERKEKENG